MPVLLLFLWLMQPTILSAQEPVADMHLHYKWSQQAVTTPEAAVDILTGQSVVLGVVIGTPAELALTLASRDPVGIVPIFSPYRTGGDWHRWARDPEVVPRARAALASGDYHGIGELHLVGGFAPRTTSGSVLAGLLELAAEYDVPVLLHTEFARSDPMLTVCRGHPHTQIIWAHAGAILPPAQVAAVLAACDNVMAGLAARDPWRFVENPITDSEGWLLPDWRDLLLRYPQRFMLGSDPVWPVDQLDRWDEEDTGWQELDRFWSHHRRWLAQLPDEVASRIACKNAVALFRAERLSACTPAATD